MPKGNKNLIQSLRSAHDPHFKLEGRVEELEKRLPIQIADLHKTLSKSFGMQRKTLVRVLGLEKKIEELQAVKEKVEEVVDDIKEEKAPEEKAPQEETVSEEEIPEGLDDVLDDIRGEKEEGSTETKKPAATKKRPKKKPTARKIPKKKPVAKKKKISAEALKKGTVLDDDFKSRVYGTDEKGEYLSPEERKMRFNKKKIKAEDIGGIKPVDPVDQPPELPADKETEGLKGIRDVLDDILKVLRLDFKGDRKEARDSQKDLKQDKRTKKENKLEGGGAIKKSVGLIGKGLKAVVSPFSNIWDSIINFIKFTLIGVLFNKAMKWFGNPQNQKKAERIGKFFKDWWPTLSAAALLFLTPLGALVKGVVGLLTAIIPKLVLAIAANPYAALALVGTGLAVWGVSKMAGGGDKKQKPVDGEGGESSDGFSDVKAEPNMGTFTGDGFQKEFEGTAGVQEFNEGGVVTVIDAPKSAQNFIHHFNEGGVVPGGESGDDYWADRGDTSHFGQIGYRMGQERPEMWVYGTEKFISKYKEKDGKIIEDSEDYQEIMGSIGMPDLIENQTQLVDSIRNVEGYEDINFMDVIQYPDGQGRLVGMPKENLFTILNASDAYKATDAKRDAAMKIDNDNNLSFLNPTKVNEKLQEQGFKGFNKGGKVPGSGNKDTVPAMLTPGEFVMSKGAVKKYGMDTLENMNAAAGSGSSSKKKDTVSSMLTPGEFVVSAPAVQKYGVDTLESMNLKGGGNNKPEIKVGANNGGLINNYNNTLMQYRGGGEVVEAPSFATGLIIKLIKKITNKNMDPVGVPVPPAKNATVTLPTITKDKPEETTTSKNDIPQFRISMFSTQRSMVISSLGISDLIGG